MDRELDFLFNHYLENLRQVSAHPNVTNHLESDDAIFCPVCGHMVFTPVDIKAPGSTRKVTLEHVPPKALGGKKLALTCKPCNSNQGSKVDEPLISFIRGTDALRGDGESFADAHVKVNDGNEVRTNFRANNEGWEIWGIPQASNPNDMDSINEHFAKQTVETINLSLELPHPRLAKVGLLRSAFLLGFAYMGYGFVMNPNLAMIREQIQNPKEFLFPEQAILMQLDIPDDFLGINIFHLLDNLKTYLIIFDVQAKRSKSHRIGVMLPGPTPNDYEIFGRLAEFDRIPANVTHHNLEFDDKIKFPFIAYEIWHDN